MSLAIDLTSNQVEIEKAERAAAELLRGLKGRIPAEFYSQIQVQHCIIASEATKLKTNLGALRMMGELEQRPPPVTAESLELARFVPVVPAFPAHAIRDERAAFALELRHIGDDTLAEDGDHNVVISGEGKGESRGF